MASARSASVSQAAINMVGRSLIGTANKASHLQDHRIGILQNHPIAEK